MEISYTVTYIYMDCNSMLPASCVMHFYLVYVMSPFILCLANALKNTDPLTSGESCPILKCYRIFCEVNGQ